MEYKDQAVDGLESPLAPSALTFMNAPCPIRLLPPNRGRSRLIARTNLEAEQALLGCLLFDNGAYERLYDGLMARHFYEPFHQRLFSTIEEQIRVGHLAEPIVLLDKFKNDQAFNDLGLAASAISPIWSTARRRPPTPTTMPASFTTWPCGVN